MNDASDAVCQDRKVEGVIQSLSVSIYRQSYFVPSAPQPCIMNANSVYILMDALRLTEFLFFLFFACHIFYYKHLRAKNNFSKNIE